MSNFNDLNSALKKHIADVIVYVGAIGVIADKLREVGLDETSLALLKLGNDILSSVHSITDEIIKYNKELGR